MTTPVIDKVMDAADQLREQAVEAERIGKLTDQTVKIMKVGGQHPPAAAQGVRRPGGAPREFAETVMATAALDPSAGWINGVVGVHPYQLAYADPRVAAEIWADDVDTWVASPYARRRGPAGGRWIHLQRTLAVQFRHRPLRLDLPRRHDRRRRRQAADAAADAAHDPAAQGLRDRRGLLGRGGAAGTGSKDVIVKDAFVPAYRTMDALKVMDGTAQREAGMTETLYLMPWSTMFPLGISSATIGIAEGALAAHLDYQRERVGAAGTAIKDDPYVMYAIGEAAADINAARQEILANADRIYDIVDAGKEVSFADRAAGRRTQIRAVWRAVMAVDQIFSRSGGNAMRMDKPLQRYWRDAHTGLAHAIHVPGTAYHASALSSFGVEPQGPLRAMI